MIQHLTQLRVRYGETDQMGITYHGNYVQYFEVGRVEMLRHVGISYASVEESGIFMPVLELHCKYHRSAKYDDLLSIHSLVKTLPSSRIHIEYEIYNEQNQLLTTGYTDLAFINSQTQRPVRCPEFILSKMRPYFE